MSNCPSPNVPSSPPPKSPDCPSKSQTTDMAFSATSTQELTAVATVVSPGVEFSGREATPEVAPADGSCPINVEFEGRGPGDDQGETKAKTSCLRMDGPVNASVVSNSRVEFTGRDPNNEANSRVSARRSSTAVSVEFEGRTPGDDQGETKAKYIHLKKNSEGNVVPASVGAIDLGDDVYTGSAADFKGLPLTAEDADEGTCAELIRGARLSSGLISVEFEGRTPGDDQGETMAKFVCLKKDSCGNVVPGPTRVIEMGEEFLQGSAINFSGLPLTLEHIQNPTKQPGPATNSLKPNKNTECVDKESSSSEVFLATSLKNQLEDAGIQIHDIPSWDTRSTTIKYGEYIDPKDDGTLDRYLNPTDCVPIVHGATKAQEGYYPHFLTRSGILPTMRGAVVDWMTGMSVQHGIPTKGLHLAVFLMDTYLFHTTVDERTFLQLGAGSLACAAKLTSEKYSNCPHLIDEEVANACDGAFSQQDVRKMSEAVYINTNLECEIPHNFLLLCMRAICDIPEDRKRKFVALCLYCLDLGLLNSRLVRYAAGMKCAAVVYLAREIFRNFCACDPQQMLCESSSETCPYHRLEPWPPQLTQAISLSASSTMKSVASIYKTALAEAKRIALTNKSQEPTKGHKPFMAAYRKFKSRAYERIALADDFTIFPAL